MFAIPTFITAIAPFPTSLTPPSLHGSHHAVITVDVIGNRSCVLLGREFVCAETRGASNSATTANRGYRLAQLTFGTQPLFQLSEVLPVISCNNSFD